jgi:methionyl-tRNA synthetase
MITIDDFGSIEIRAGTIIEASDLEVSDKLLRLKVDFGELGVLQVLSGIKKWYKPTSLVGKQFIFVTNLEAREMMGERSEAMILAVKTSNKPVIIKPATRVGNGQLVG